MFSNSTGAPLDLPGVDNGSCQLLGPTALTVQGVMGVVVVLSLVYKRHRETPKRPWKIWLFDVSKQILGQAFVHGVNVLVSGLSASDSFSNACVSYFLNILIDTTLGVGLLFLILRVFSYLLTTKWKFEGFESGVYGSPPSFIFWIKQTTIYVASLTAMKFIVIGLIQLFPGLDEIGSWLLSWTYTKDGDAVQVIFVMGVFPILMNIIQFWIIDSIVKSSKEPVKSDPEGGLVTDEDREPLISTEDEEEAPNGKRTNATDEVELHEYPPRLSGHPESQSSTDTDISKLSNSDALSPPQPARDDDEVEETWDAWDDSENWVQTDNNRKTDSQDL